MNTPSDRERIITLNPGIFCFCHSALERQGAYIKFSRGKRVRGDSEWAETAKNKRKVYIWVTILK